MFDCNIWRFGSILQNIKNMIPGSKLQIKEKNAKLLGARHLTMQ